MNSSVTRVLLQAYPIFECLSEDQWQLLSTQTRLVSMTKNKNIYQLGSDVSFVYMVERGSVKVGSYSSQNKILVKEIAYAGDFFGENIFTHGIVRKDFAETTSDSKFFKIPVQIFKDLVIQNGTLANSLMSITLNKLQYLEERLQNFVFMKAKERIVHFLHKSALRKGINIGLDEKLINQGISHKDIAFLTDTSRQTVARVLNELKRDNIIHYGGGKSCKILVRDMFTLEKLSLVG
ncbi:MAG: Crp/Fnr family transcriptional regulator [Saprospiraceae bacterium]